MKTLATFYDLIMPELPGISTALVDQYLIQMAREICEHSRAWREDFDATDAFAGQATYDVFAPETKAELVAVHKLTVGSVLLFDDSWRMPITRYELDTADAPKYRKDNPPFSISADLTQLTLIDDEIPSADAVGSILITGSMKPAMDATSLPDWLYVVHARTLKSAVLSALMAQAGKPWSAPAQSGLYAADYASRLQFAATNAQTGNTRRVLRTRQSGI